METVHLSGPGNAFFHPGSSTAPDAKTKKRKGCLNGEKKSDGPPSKVQKTGDVDQQTPAHDKSRTGRGESSPESTTTTQKSVSRQLADEFDDGDGYDQSASPEKKLIQHLKTISEVKLRLLRTSSLAYDLIATYPKFTEACSDLPRGVLQLKEGLTTITKVLRALEAKDEA